MEAHKPFYFYTRLNQTELLGRSARNVVELLEGIRAVPDSSPYHHTHRIVQQSHCCLHVNRYRVSPGA